MRAERAEVARWHNLDAAGGATTVYVVESARAVEIAAAAGVVAVCADRAEWTVAHADDLRDVLRAHARIRLVYPARDLALARAHCARLRDAGVCDVEILDVHCYLGDPAAGLAELAAKCRGSLAMLLAALPRLDEPATAREAAVGILLSDVEPEAVDWIWHGRLARGKLSLLEGRPDEGKTTLALDLAARVSTGSAMPDAPTGLTRPAAGVVVVTAEDGLADTIRPRLYAAGADLTRVLAARPGHEAPSLDAEGLDWLRRACARVDAALVVLDPLVALIPGRVDAHRDQDVRRMLRPLRALAEECRVAVLAIRHLRKSLATDPRDAGGGSVALGAAARIVMLAARDPDGGENARVLARVKSNLSAPWASLRYRLVPAAGTVRVEWGDESPHDATALLAAAGDGEVGGAVEQAEALVADLLRDGPRPSRDLDRAAEAAGISRRTLMRARARLRVEAQQAGRRWLVRLPDAQDATPGGDGTLALWHSEPDARAEKPSILADAPVVRVPECQDATLGDAGTLTSSTRLDREPGDDDVELVAHALDVFRGARVVDLPRRGPR